MEHLVAGGGHQRSAKLQLKQSSNFTLKVQVKILTYVCCEFGIGDKEAPREGTEVSSTNWVAKGRENPKRCHKLKCEWKRRILLQ